MIRERLLISRGRLLWLLVVVLGKSCLSMNFGEMLIIL
jgi:hypothetical protein